MAQLGAAAAAADHGARGRGRCDERPAGRRRGGLRCPGRAAVRGAVHAAAGERPTVLRVGKGHLPGAVHLCKGIIERDIENAVPAKTTPMVLYCGGGFRSALAADNLQKMGYTQVFSMDGGIRSWREKGFTLTKS